MICCNHHVRHLIEWLFLWVLFIKSSVIRNLFDVERGHQCDSFYQRQQRAVVDSHPGHRLTVDLVQDVEWDQEALFPRQPGQQGRGPLLPHQPVRDRVGKFGAGCVLQLSFISSSYLWISWSPVVFERVTPDTLTFPLKRQLWLRGKTAVDVKQTHFLG